MEIEIAKKLAIVIKIIETAKNYVGQKELPPNAGFKDKYLTEKMIKIGWKKGWHWCCLFAKLVFKESYSAIYGDNSEQVNSIVKLFSANSQQTYRNFEKKGLTGKEPRPGAVMILKYKGVSGHTGIVTEVRGEGYFMTVEGNNKDMVREVLRSTTNPSLLGFCYLPEYINAK